LSSINAEGHVLNKLNDELGIARVVSGTYSSGSEGHTGFISLVDKDERGRIWRGTTGDGIAEGIHTDCNGVVRIRDFTDGDSSKDPSEEEDASDFLGGRWYANPYGTCRLWTGSDRGRTGVSLYDWSDIPRIGFRTGFSGQARMWLTDGEGEMVWSEDSEGEQAEQP
ncbi:MAG: hypothetical protein MK089_12890, partial [Phycisphaerales bacterium]|nr:hypothetical protein [Phycisphaerales bacterium]